MRAARAGKIDEYMEAQRANATVAGEAATSEPQLLVPRQRIDNYIDYALAFKEDSGMSKQDEYLDFIPASKELVEDLQGDIDLTGFVHSIRDNDVRHIKLSHGEGTKEKYPITTADLKLIPDFVTNYDDVLYVPNGKKKEIYYVKQHNGVTYYLEQVVENGKRLANKQMIKVPTGTIPDIKGLKAAINKKWRLDSYTSDAANAVPSMYVQDVGNQSPSGLTPASVQYGNDQAVASTRPPESSTSSSDNSIPTPGEKMQAEISPLPGVSALGDKPLGINDTNFRDATNGGRKLWRRFKRSIVSGQAETERAAREQKKLNAGAVNLDDGASCMLKTPGNAAAVSKPTWPASRRSTCASQ